MILRVLLVVVAMSAAGCKDKPKARPAPVAAAPTPARTIAPPPPVDEPPPPAPAPPPAVDAAVDAPVHDAAPTRSELALAARSEFFGSVGKVAKRADGNCAQLGADLDALAPQARAIAARRAEVEGADVEQDEAMVRSLLKSVTQLTSGCEDSAQVDAFLSTLGAR